MRQISKLLALVIGIAHGVAVAQVGESSVSGVGNGATRDAAISSALANAAAQAFGIRIEATTVSASTAVEVSGDVDTSVYMNALNRQIATKVRAPGNRPILGFEVTSAVQGTGGLWDAEVTMRYASFERLGPTSDRRSVIVVTPGKRFADVLVDAVEKSLVESRRFDVLDRNNTALYDQEKLFIRGPDTAAAEVSRLGNASGADYLLIAEFQDLSILNDQRETIRLTGEQLVSSSVSGTLKLQMVEFASRKVKWSGSRKFSRTYEDVSSIGRQIMTRHTSTAADDLIAGMLDAIYPIRVVKVVGNLAVINRGEGAVTRGEKFRVFLVGEELVDPQSGESLGAMEVDVGSGVISEVKPKFAYLRVEGAALDGAGSYLIRKMP